MPTEIEKAFQLALEVANEPEPVTEKVIPEPESETPSSSVTPPLRAGDVAAALTLVQTIAHGRDPYTTDESSRHLPEHNPETMKALCVVATHLLELAGAPNRALPNRAFDSELTSETRGSLSLVEFLDRIERREILLTLKACRFNRTEAARVLGITFRAMRYRMERLGIE